VIAPGAVVGDVHALLALPGGGHQGQGNCMTHHNFILGVPLDLDN
jgi:hypothetical protein